MDGLGSAPVPAIGPGDHVRGSGPEAVLYMDLACPACAALWERARELPLRLCVRHFPLSGQRPRSPALHAATEAAARQSEAAFWLLWDWLFYDQAHSDDPHLWQRAREIGLELERFDRERRSEEVVARVRGDFRGGIRAGVSGTPAAFAGRRQLRGDLVAGLDGLVGR